MLILRILDCTVIYHLAPISSYGSDHTPLPPKSQLITPPTQNGAPKSTFVPLLPT